MLIDLWREKFEIRECATLGTFWRDIYMNGELFAAEVPTEAAEDFISDPQLYAHLCNTPLVRGLYIERVYEANGGEDK